MLALIDNYDSFTYNLVHYFEALGEGVCVFRNDQISVPELRALSPERVVISPGPGLPREAGISCDVIRAFAGIVPILGVCLGHQCLATVFGGRIVRAAEPVHAKTSAIHHDASPPFNDLPTPFTATRYHSLIVDLQSLPPEFRITARTANGEIMGLCHTRFTAMGVQFHPESIITEHGLPLLQNFLAVRGGQWRE